MQNDFHIPFSYKCTSFLSCREFPCVVFVITRQKRPRECIYKKMECENYNQKIRRFILNKQGLRLYGLYPTGLGPVNGLVPICMGFVHFCWSSLLLVLMQFKKCASNIHKKAVKKIKYPHKRKWIPRII